jgi:hypothetical protein
MILDILAYMGKFKKIHPETCPHMLINWVVGKHELTSKQKDGKVLPLPWTTNS